MRYTYVDMIVLQIAALTISGELDADTPSIQRFDTIHCVALVYVSVHNRVCIRPGVLYYIRKLSHTL